MAVKVVHPGLRQNLHRVSSSTGTLCILGYIWQSFGSGSGSSIEGRIPIRIRIQGLMTKNKKKYTAEKNLIFFDKKLQLTYLGLHKGRSSYRKSLQPLKENIYLFFLLLWVIFALLDPNSESGSLCVVDPVDQYIISWPPGSGS